MPRLTQDDLDRLVSQNSPEVRASLLAKITDDFNSGTMPRQEKDLAIAIFRVMAEDIESVVRQTLAETLKENNDLPRDLAVALAEDIEEVSVPILQFSKVLEHEDLLALVALSGENQKVAIARRDVLNGEISEALVETGTRKVVSTLVRNNGAEITEKVYGKVIDRYAAAPEVTEGLVLRDSLPSRVAERLVSIVSGELQEHLVTHHEISPILAESVILKTRQKALMGFGLDTTDRNVEKLVEKLYQSGRLTSEIIIRAIEIGDRSFFETALARRAGVPLVNAVTLIGDDGGNGLRALYHKADMPTDDFMSVRFLVDLAYGYDIADGSASDWDADLAAVDSWVSASDDF